MQQHPIDLVAGYSPYDPLQLKYLCCCATNNIIIRGTTAHGHHNEFDWKARRKIDFTKLI